MLSLTQEDMDGWLVTNRHVVENAVSVSFYKELGCAFHPLPMDWKYPEHEHAPDIAVLRVKLPSNTRVLNITDRHTGYPPEEFEAQGFTWLAVDDDKPSRLFCC